MFGTMVTKLLWFVTAVTIQGGYLPSSCQIDTASSAVYIALYPTNRSLREELIDTLREAFKNKNDETYGIFHMLVDPPPLPTYGKFFRDFLLSKKDF